MKNPREVWMILRFCSYIEKLSVAYKTDWIKSQHNIVGFYGYVTGEGDKLKRLEQIKMWCDDKHLPVEIIDEPEMKTRFKIKLIK